MIVEDESDYLVLKKIFSKARPDINFEFRKYFAGGCGRLKSKCAKWTRNLVDEGCAYIFVFQDLDRNDLADLRADLQRKVASIEGATKFIIVPIEEIEAWLLTDPQAIKRTFSSIRHFPSFKAIEAIRSPKEFLRDQIYRWSEKSVRYVNATHNPKIAEHLDIRRVGVCSAFIPLRTALSGLIVQ